MSNITRLMVMLSLVFLSPLLLADDANQVKYKGYTIHFTAYPSDHLQPNIAKAIGIKRDAARTVVTVVVNKNKPGKTPTSVKASVNGNAFYMSGMRLRLKLRELNDRGATYYISDFKVKKGEKLTFAMSVKPDGESQEKEFKFVKQF